MSDWISAEDYGRKIESMAVALFTLQHNSFKCVQELERQQGWPKVLSIAVSVEIQAIESTAFP